ncbi:hypothetical protein [Sinorhizobium fredii]|uniref:hypothetical protein n=1 Tax=Rhizobium fredii TaxID=380 RepID=UPI0005655DF8|nr:hypothetical protein [Sinorhizobium fredii]
MSRANFRQADIERILRAARREGATVQIDLRTLVVTVLPAADRPSVGAPTSLDRFGSENWDD